MQAQEQQLPFLLRIPVELRLQIYEYAVLPPKTITISGTPGYWDRSAKSLESNEQGDICGQEVWIAEGFREDLLLPEGAVPASGKGKARRVFESDPCCRGVTSRGLEDQMPATVVQDAREHLAPQDYDQIASTLPTNLRTDTDGRPLERFKAAYEAGARMKQAVHGLWIGDDPGASSSSSSQSSNSSLYRREERRTYNYTEALKPDVGVQRTASSSAKIQQSRRIPVEGLLDYAVESLHLTCRQIHAEMLEHLPPSDNYNRNIDLYVSYPAGVTLLAYHCSHILKQAKNITILGISTLDDNAGLGLERVQDMQDYVWENVDVAPKSMSYNHISPEDMLARHQINSLASVIARLLGRVAFEEEQDYRDRQEARLKAADDVNVPERRLSFSSIPREPTPPPLIITNRSGPSTLSHSNAEGFDSVIDDIRRTPYNNILTIDPPPSPTTTASRKRSSSPAPPPATSPTLHLRIFHPRRISTPIYPSQRQQDLYTQVWSHVFSPITIAMSNIYGGHIALSVARGEKGVGIAATVKGNGGLGRQVSSRWPVLAKGDEGREWLFERRLDGHEHPAMR